MDDEMPEVWPDPTMLPSDAIEYAWRQTGKKPVRFFFREVDMVIYPKDKLAHAVLRYRLRRLWIVARWTAALAVVLGLAVGFLQGWSAGLWTTLAVLLTKGIFCIPESNVPPANP